MTRSDSDRIRWLEETHHVLCFDSDEWFCAWRGNDGWGWTDLPTSDTVRGAIDAGIAAWEEEQGTKP